MNYLQKQAYLNKIANIKLSINYKLRHSHIIKKAATRYGEYNPDDLPTKKPWPSKDKFDTRLYKKLEKERSTPLPGKAINNNKQYKPVMDSIKKYRKMYPWATPTNYFFQPNRQLSDKDIMKYPEEIREGIKKRFPDGVIPPEYYEITPGPGAKYLPKSEQKLFGIYTGSSQQANDHEKGHWYSDMVLSPRALFKIHEKYNPGSGTFDKGSYEMEYPAIAQQLDTAIRNTSEPIMDDTVYYRREYMPAQFMGNMPVGADTFGTTQADPVHSWTYGLDGKIDRTDRNFGNSYPKHEKEKYPELAKENDAIEQNLQQELDKIDPNLDESEKVLRRFEALMKVHPSLYNMARRGNYNSYMRANNDFNDPTNNYQKRKDIADAYSYLRENFKNWDGDGIDEPRMNPRLWRVIQKYQVDPDLNTDLPRNILPLDQLNNMKDEVDLIQKASPYLDRLYGFDPTA